LSTNIGIGFSQTLDPQEAAVEACAQAKNNLRVSDVDLVMLLTSTHYARQEVLDVVSKLTKPRHLIGCSTGSIILADRTSPRGIAVLALNSSEIPCSTGLVTDISSTDFRQSGFELARKASQDLKISQRQALLVLSDNIYQNNTQFIHGAQEALGFGFPILGAVSSDNFKFKTTYQFSEGKVVTNAAVGLLMGGAFTIALGNKHGFIPLGKPRTITNVNNNIIRTIDKQPAVRIYENYMGEGAFGARKDIAHSPAMLYPLGIYISQENQYLLRNPIDILDDGSIVCQGDVSEGAEVHLMISNKDSCRQAAIDAAESVKAGLSGKQAKLILIFVSMAHHKILGRSLFMEIQAIKEVLGFTTLMFGMGSYGELAPFGSLDNIKNTHLHNGGVLIIAIG
jgi:hypothetical protein